MMDRNLHTRLVFVAAVTLAANPILRAQIQTDNPESETLTTIAPAPAPAPATTPANVKVAVPVVSYTVVHGDTLGSIAHKCGITLAQLKRLNNLPETEVKVKPGEVLQVVYVKAAP